MYTLLESHVLRDDGAIIPFNPENRDYSEYLNWVSLGNTPKDPPVGAVEDLGWVGIKEI